MHCWWLIREMDSIREQVGRNRGIREWSEVNELDGNGFNDTSDIGRVGFCNQFN